MFPQYLPKEEFERIILKVQQSRQEKEDEFRWQQHLAQLNKTTPECKDDPQTWHVASSTTSSSGSSSSSDLDEKTMPSQLPSRPKRIGCILKSTPPERSKNVAPIEQHAKTNEAIVKVQLGIQSLLANIAAQIEALKDMNTEEEEENEPTSARAVKLRGTRLVEFNARFRRNYIYPLQVEVIIIYLLFKLES